MDSKEVLIGLLSVQTKKNAEEIASLIQNEDGSFKDDALNILKDIDAERVSNLTKESFDSGVKKTQSTLLSKRERDIKERYQIESQTTGLDLIDEIINSKKETVEVKGSITDADIEKHPLFLNTIEQKQKEFEDYRKQVESENNQREVMFQKQKTFSIVKNKALELLRNSPIIIEDDNKVAQNRINQYVNTLQNHNYQIQDDKILLINDEGELIKNAHGNRIDFNEHILGELRNHFAFKKTEERTSAGQTTKKVESGSIYTGHIPTNEEEYVQMIGDKTKSIEERMAIKEAYYKSNP